MANGKDGEKDASVLSTATVGDHEYTTGPTGNNPSAEGQQLHAKWELLLDSHRQRASRQARGAEGS